MNTKDFKREARKIYNDFIKELDNDDFIEKKENKSILEIKDRNVRVNQHYNLKRI